MSRNVCYTLYLSVIDDQHVLKHKHTTNTVTILMHTNATHYNCELTFCREHVVHLLTMIMMTISNSCELKLHFIADHGIKNLDKVWKTSLIFFEIVQAHQLGGKCFSTRANGQMVKLMWCRDCINVPSTILKINKRAEQKLLSLASTVTGKCCSCELSSTG